MKVLGYLLTPLAVRLIIAVVKFIANWSLDTVNTSPLTQIARARIKKLANITKQASFCD